MSEQVTNQFVICTKGGFRKWGAGVCGVEGGVVVVFHSGSRDNLPPQLRLALVNHSLLIENGVANRCALSFQIQHTLL